MVTLTLTHFLIVCPLRLLAGFVDAVAGGGGLISLPAYLISGLPVHSAIGTNKPMMSAVVVFFRDLSQLINIVLQVGMWVTPIMWNFNGMEGRVPHILMEILKLNPFYYIVTGYRETLFDHVGFWNHPLLTLYFWLVVLLFLFIGGRVFTKLQDHFADVL